MLLTRLFAGLRSARAEFERGTAAAQEGRLAEAIVMLRRAVELKPGLAEAHYNLAAAYRDLGESDASLAAYRRAAQLAPRFADVHVDIASLLEGARGAPLLVVVDGVEDPHNLGALLRTVEAAGADGVVQQTRHAAALGGAGDGQGGSKA